MGLKVLKLMVVFLLPGLNKDALSITAPLPKEGLRHDCLSAIRDSNKKPLKYKVVPCLVGLLLSRVLRRYRNIPSDNGLTGKVKRIGKDLEMNRS